MDGAKRASRRTGARALQNVSKKMEQSISEGNFYEAEQMCRTLHYRYAQANDEEKAVEVLLIGIETLMAQGQIACGHDLATMLVQYYTGPPLMPSSQSAVDALLKAGGLYPEPCAQLVSFLRGAIKWSISSSDAAAGDARLHGMMASSCQSLGDISAAQRHIVRSAQPQRHAELLVEMSLQAHATEQDLFITRAVLQYCCLRNVAHAEHALSTFVNLTSHLDTPLIHFCRFLLSTLQKGEQALPLFQLLCSRYERALQRDRTFGQYLDRIAELFFNVKQPKTGLGGMMDMFQAMMGDEPG